FAVMAHVEDAAYVRVRDLPCQVDLALEALGGLLVESDLGADRLQGHAPAQLDVLGLVHLAHAAAGHEAQDLVAVGDQLAGAEHRTAGPRRAPRGRARDIDADRLDAAHVHRGGGLRTRVETDLGGNGRRGFVLGQRHSSGSYRAAAGLWHAAASQL